MQNRLKMDRVPLQMVCWPAEKAFELESGRVFWARRRLAGTLLMEGVEGEYVYGSCHE